MTEKTLEQEARDLLEECGVEDVQQFTDGDLVSIANKLNECYALRDRIAELEAREKRLRALAKFGRQVLHRFASEKETPYRNAFMFLALSMDLLTAQRGSFLLTELAQLPEEL